jgi:sugar lactone lactonase YvrE
MRTLLAVVTFLLGADPSAAADPFDRGTAIPLDRAISANERGILCLAEHKGRVYGGTTGRAAHLFEYDPKTEHARSIARFPGGVGLAYGLVVLPDGSLICGTQTDPTGIAVRTDPKAIGKLYRITPSDEGKVVVEDLGVAVPGQGIYTLAYHAGTNTVVGNTWPDGHFFSYDVKAKTFKDHGAIAGYRTFETPRHAEDLNRGSGEKISYPRQVSRAIIISGDLALTGGADGYVYRYDLKAKKLEKTGMRLPAARGRESWASLDAAVEVVQLSFAGGTSDGYLFLLHPLANDIECLGKPFAAGSVQGLVFNGSNYFLGGVGGSPQGMPRSFGLNPAAVHKQFELGGIPRVDGQPSMVGFGALRLVGDVIYAGERDRIGRLVRFPLKPADAPKQPPLNRSAPSGPIDDTPPPPLDYRVVFAPAGTTTDGSGYTAIEVGHDGKVYVGAARYGGYAWLLRFQPPVANAPGSPLFMDKVVNMQQLTGERLQGINTQGKIHAKMLVGADGRVWFASKQAHEVFDTRPEFEDRDGYPGGHLCYFDPKTGFSRSMGILKKQQGLMAGAIDDTRGKLYYRSEPENNFLVYDLKTGDVQDRGHVGAACRYMAMDGKGNVYSPGRGPYLSRYAPETGYVEDLLIKVEGDGAYTPPYVILAGPDGKLYGLAAGHPSVMVFDIDKVKEGDFPEVPMRNVAPAAPAGMPVQDIHAAVFGKDGRLYYPLNTTGPIGKGGKPVVHLRIMRFDPKTGKTETVGLPRVVDFDEEKVKHVYTRADKFALRYMQGAAVGADGSLYLMGIYPQLHVACFPKLTAAK